MEAWGFGLCAVKLEPGRCQEPGGELGARGAWCAVDRHRPGVLGGLGLRCGLASECSPDDARGTLKLDRVVDRPLRPAGRLVSHHFPFPVEPPVRPPFDPPLGAFGFCGFCGFGLLLRGGIGCCLSLEVGDVELEEVGEDGEELGAGDLFAALDAAEVSVVGLGACLGAAGGEFRESPAAL